MPEDDLGYYAGENEDTIEDIIERKKQEMATDEDTMEDEGDYAEDVAQAEKVERRKLGTGEPIYLYIHTGPGVAELVNQVFDSRIEAGQYAEENFPGAKYEVMSQSEIQSYLEKQQRRQERIESAKETIKRGGKKVVRKAEDVTGKVTEGLEEGIHASVRSPTRRQRVRRPQPREYARPGGRAVGRTGRAFFEASRDQAQRYGMTRETMQPEIEEAWGLEERSPVTGRDLEGQPLYDNRRTKYGTPKKALRTPDLRPYDTQSYRGPPRRGKLNIPKPRKVRLNIPPFKTARISQPRPKANLSQPRQRSRVNMRPGLRKAPIHFVGTRGPYDKRRPNYGEPIDEKTTVTKTKKYKKKPKKKNKKRKR